jgi:hypothetical protein
VVVKHQAAIEMTAERRAVLPARRSEVVGRPRPAYVPGKHLRTAVDSVLAQLDDAEPDDTQTMHRLDDLLRAGLAWTAALGDTCQVAAAVHAVRDARVMLDSADPDQAKLALLSARDGLRPSMPGPRPAY